MRVTNCVFVLVISCMLASLAWSLNVDLMNVDPLDRLADEVQRSKENRLDVTPDTWKDPNPLTPQQQRDQAVQYLGTGCHVVSGDGCNGLQIPGTFTNSGGSFYYVAGLRAVDVQPTDSDIQLYQVNSLKKKISGTFYTNTNQVISAAEDSFQIGGSLPYGGMTFSGSSGYRSITSQMYTTSSQSYVAESFVTFSTYAASIIPDSLGNLRPSAAVQSLIDQLPNNVSSVDNLLQYFDFFDKFGTHFVSSIEYGSILFASASITTSSAQSSGVDQSRLSAAFGGVIADKAGLDASFGADTNKSEVSAVGSRLSNYFMTTYGGVVREPFNLSFWVNSVSSSNSAPISTHVQPVSILFPDIKAAVADEAFNALVTRCPHDVNNNICSGHGYCTADYLKNTCDCMPGYSGTDCSVRNCRAGGCGNGVCDTKTGLCKCNDHWNGCGCDQPCGERVFMYPTTYGYPLGCGQTKYYACTDDGLGPGTSQATCFCKENGYGGSKGSIIEQTNFVKATTSCTGREYPDCREGTLYGRCYPYNSVTCYFPTAPTCIQPSFPACTPV